MVPHHPSTASQLYTRLYRTATKVVCRAQFSLSLQQTGIDDSWDQLLPVAPRFPASRGLFLAVRPLLAGKLSGGSKNVRPEVNRAVYPAKQFVCMRLNLRLALIEARNNPFRMKIVSDLAFFLGGSAQCLFVIRQLMIKRIIFSQKCEVLC